MLLAAVITIVYMPFAVRVMVTGLNGASDRRIGRQTDWTG
jgi:hypothetical protein